MNKMHCLGFVTLWFSASGLVNAEPRKEDKFQEFHVQVLTRSWELGIWRVKNEVTRDERSALFKLSMTAQAFRYWLLVKQEIAARSLVYESQIRKSFSVGDLDVNTLKNPLNRNSDGEGGFGVGMLLGADEYARLSREFERDFTTKTDGN